MLGTRLGTLYADLVPRDRLVATVRPLFERYHDERLEDERFGDFCHRVGLEAVRASVPIGSRRSSPGSSPSRGAPPGGSAAARSPGRKGPARPPPGGPAPPWAPRPPP